MALTKVRGDGVQGMSLLSTSTALTLDANGHVTKPLQSAFQVKPSSNQNNIALTDETIAFGTEIFDNNSDFSSNTFTAPVTGKYQLQLTARIDNIDTAADYNRIYVQTSNRRYQSSIIDLGGLSGDPVHWSMVFCVLADMDANDTVYLQWNQSSGAAQADFDTDAEFSGFLVC